ncbi:unnamed protein product [Effrenium voratum]|uniref:MIF4G domain-containing protein n=1 Tax=Effrenium voratum TaxID=2562239 RepID=A0AA36J540_9DINO|nr:unnamed protein product [Effrenium voratum]
MTVAEISVAGIRRKVKQEVLRSLPLLPLQENDKDAAAQVMERRAKLMKRWKADHSTFSILHLDVCKRENAPSAARTTEEVLIMPRKAPKREVSKCSDVSTVAISEEKAEDMMSTPSTPSSEQAPDLPETNFLEVRRKLLSYRNSIPQDERPDYVVEVVSLPATQAAIKRDEGFMRQQSEPVPSKSFAGTMRRQVSAQVERPRRAAPVQLTPSANAWKPKKESNPQEELKRQVQGLLNKICPENVASIIEKIAAIKVEEITQLEAIIELMFKKAITEPHYCETYADMVFSLKAVYPSFPAPDGGKPVTFKGLVLNICQSEFEQLLTSGDVTEEEKAKLDHEEIDFLRKKRKDRMRANMKFIGHLFLRQLLSAKVIGSVICELVLCEQVEDLPEEHALECACELLLAIGYTMENMAAGQTALTSVCGRLKDLMKRKREDGKAAYCKRVQFMIQDVLDTRAAGWQKKVFKAAAKTKEEIRLEQEKKRSRIGQRERTLRLPAAW